MRGRSSLEGPIAHDVLGLRIVTTEDLAGVRQVANAVLGIALQKRCQYHLSRNAWCRVPNWRIRITSLIDRVV